MRIGLAHILGSDIGHAPTFHAIPAVQLRSFADDNRDQGGISSSRRMQQVKQGIDLTEVGRPVLAQVHRCFDHFHEHVLLLLRSKHKSLLPWQPNSKTLSPGQTIIVD